jgi:creatinine amidohydrolase/Fe(II)-dependent formamide hydrolase-like protein
MEQIMQMLLEYGLLGAVALMALYYAWIERRERMAAERRERKVWLAITKLQIDNDQADEYEMIAEAAETKPIRDEIIAEAVEAARAAAKES